MEKIELTFTELDNKDFTADDLTGSASELAHVRNIMKYRKILNTLWDKYNKAYCAKYGGKSTDTVTIVNRSWFTIDEDKVLEELGADGLARVKTKPVVQTFVSKL